MHGCWDALGSSAERPAWAVVQPVPCLQLLTDAAIQAVAQGCPQLKELNVGRCARLTDVSIRSLAGSCTQLESLTTRYCPLLTSAVVRALEQGCRQLKYLDMIPFEIEIPLTLRGEIPLRNVVLDGLL